MRKKKDRQKPQPYLPQGRENAYKNQTSASEKMHILIQPGFLYLTAVMDWYSRYVAGGDIGNASDAASRLRVLHEAVADIAPTLRTWP